MLEDCKEFLGARGGTLPKGIANSSTFGWINPCLGLLTTSSLDLEKTGWALLTNRVELISYKYICLTVSTRWGFGISLSAWFFLGPSHSRQGSIHYFMGLQLSRAAAQQQCWTGNKTTVSVHYQSAIYSCNKPSKAILWDTTEDLLTKIISTLCTIRDLIWLSSPLNRVVLGNTYI